MAGRQVMKTARLVAMLTLAGLALSACGRRGEPVLAAEEAADAAVQQQAVVPIITRNTSRDERPKPTRPFLLDPLM